jgi:hypothetical protein
MIPRDSTCMQIWCMLRISYVSLQYILRSREASVPVIFAFAVLLARLDQYQVLDRSRWDFASSNVPRSLSDNCIDHFSSPSWDPCPHRASPNSKRLPFEPVRQSTVLLGRSSSGWSVWPNRARRLQSPQTPYMPRLEANMSWFWLLHLLRLISHWDWILVDSVVERAATALAVHQVEDS